MALLYCFMVAWGSIQDPFLPTISAHTKQECLHAPLAMQEIGRTIRLQHFLLHHPHSVQKDVVHYQLGHCFYQQGHFAQTERYYKKVKATALPTALRPHFAYEQAYTYLELKKWKQAGQALEQLKDKQHPYYYPAQLQRARWAIEQGKYTIALEALHTLHASPTHGLAAQQLMVHTLHQSGQFEAVLQYAAQHPEVKSDSSHHLLMGDAHLFLGQYTAAAQHYQLHAEKHEPSKIERTMQAKWAYAHYQNQQWEIALKGFEKLLTEQDGISQMAYYYIGLMYTEQNRLQDAMQAFWKAKTAHHDCTLHELAWLRFAILAYQQEAFDQAAAEMEMFITTHPNSCYLVTAQTVLATCYYQTKAYKAAVDYIEQLPYKNEPLLALQPKSLFYYGLLAYNNRQPEAAVAAFKQAMLFPIPRELLVQTWFWLAEALSCIENYPEALTWYNTFIQEGSSTAYYAKAMYGMAYAYFNQGQYTEAGQHFSQYISITHQAQGSSYYDAMLRLADCAYVAKQYGDALKKYTHVSSYQPAYVCYQQALTYQALGQPTEAKRCMQELIDQYQESPYYAKALYWEACTSFNEGAYQVAIEQFEWITYHQLDQEIAAEVLMKKALAHENLKQYKAASDAYMAILDHHTQHVHGQGAFMALSKLMAEQGLANAIAPYLKKYAHLAGEKAKNRDQYLLEQAKKLFYSEQYAKTIEQLDHFERNHPKSTLHAQADFLVAESYYRLNKLTWAKQHYQKATQGPDQELAKKAWFRIASIASQGRKFQEALICYQKLKQMKLTHKEGYLTRIGLAQASFALKQYKITTPTCLQLVNQAKTIPVEVRQEAHLYLGKIAMQRSSHQKAEHHFGQAARPTHTPTAAAAQYCLAQAAYQRKKYKRALQALFDLTEQFACNQAYINDAFLCMADVYIAMHKPEQAKATLDSIIQQSKDKKTIERAKKKKRSANF